MRLSRDQLRALFQHAVERCVNLDTAEHSLGDRQAAMEFGRPCEDCFVETALKLRSRPAKTLAGQGAQRVPAQTCSGPSKVHVFESDGDSTICIYCGQEDS